MFIGALSGIRGAGAQLAFHVNAASDGSTWSYTLFNDEDTRSPNYVTSFSLAVNAPVTVTGTPGGWASDTDGSSYVYWYNTDPVLPYPNDIAPGAMLSGFSVSSPGAHSVFLGDEAVSWDHDQDAPGPIGDNKVLAPSTVASRVPEPGASLLLIAAAIAWILHKRRN